MTNAGRITKSCTDMKNLCQLCAVPLIYGKKCVDSDDALRVKVFYHCLSHLFDNNKFTLIGLIPRVCAKWPPRVSLLLPEFVNRSH